MTSNGHRRLGKLEQALWLFSQAPPAAHGDEAERQQRRTEIDDAFAAAGEELIGNLSEEGCERLLAQPDDGAAWRYIDKVLALAAAGYLPGAIGPAAGVINALIIDPTMRPFGGQCGTCGLLLPVLADGAAAFMTCPGCGADDAGDAPGWWSPGVYCVRHRELCRCRYCQHQKRPWCSDSSPCPPCRDWLLFHGRSEERTA